MADALQNREIFRKAMSQYDPHWGQYNQPALAGLLDCSKTHIANLLSGAKPLAGPTKAKLDALIAAKGDGPVESGFTPTPLDQRTGWPDEQQHVEQFEVDLPGDLPGPSIAEEYRVDPMPSAPAQGKHRWMGRYMVIHMSLGEYALVEILAPFRDAGTANLICDMLNKEGG